MKTTRPSKSSTSSPPSAPPSAPTRKRSRPSSNPSPPPSPKSKTSLDLYRALLATLNPAYFARQFLQFIPDPAQQRALLASVSNRRIALNCNRQWGKSTCAAILAAHRLFTCPKSTVLIVAPSGRQSGETLHKVAAFLSVLGIRTRGDGVNRASLVLPNGSRIVSLPAVDATVRGFSAVSLLIVDEASRVADAVYLALRPALAVSGGDIVLVSTPHGRRGFFYREMTSSAANQQESWYRHTGPITECLTRIPPEFIAEEQARGESYFRQEYLCEFVETGKYIFDEQLLHQIAKKELEAFTWI